MCGFIDESDGVHTKFIVPREAFCARDATCPNIEKDRL